MAAEKQQAASLGSKMASAIKRMLMSDSDVGAVSAGCAAGAVGAIELFVERLTAAAMSEAGDRRTTKIDVGHMYVSEKTIHIVHHHERIRRGVRWTVTTRS